MNMLLSFLYLWVIQVVYEIRILRAQLAEAFEAILPNKQHGGGRTINRFA